MSFSFQLAKYKFAILFCHLIANFYFIDKFYSLMASLFLFSPLLFFLFILFSFFFGLYWNSNQNLVYRPILICKEQSKKGLIITFNTLIQGLSTYLSQSLSWGGGAWVWWFGFEFGGCCFRSAVAGGLGWLWIVVGSRLRWSWQWLCQNNNQNLD